MSQGQQGPTHPAPTRVLHHVRQLVQPSGQPASDRQLLDRFANQGDQAAFAELVARHGPMVLAVCRRIVGDAHEAEDAFQAAWLVLASKVRSVRWAESIAGWLHAVAHRVACKARHQASRRERQQRELPVMAAAQTGEPREEELLGLVHDELARLPEKYRTVLVLCYLEGKTNAEAALVLNCPVGSMSKLLARARELLRRRLAGHGATVPLTALPAILARGGSATVGETLQQATIQAATLVVAGNMAVTDATSASVACLVEGVLREMFREKLKLGLLLAFTLVVLSAGAGVLGYHSLAGDPPKRVLVTRPDLSAKASQPASVPAAPARARTFRSTLPLVVYQILDDEEPRVLGWTGLAPSRPINIPAGANWFVQPLGGVGLAGVPGMPGGGVNIGTNVGVNIGTNVGVNIGFGGGASGVSGVLGMPAGGVNIGNNRGVNIGTNVGVNIGFTGGVVGNLGGNPALRTTGKKPGVSFGTALTGDSLKALVAEMKKQAVPGLRVSRMTVSEADAAQLASIPGLRTLLFQGPSIDDRGLAKLKGCKSLRLLGLEGTGVTAAGLETLKEVSGLSQLHLAGDRIDNKALEALRECKSLTGLRLSATRVNGEGLAVLKSLSNLTTLDLAGPFTDSDLKVLNEMPALKAIRLHQTKMTDATLQTLKELKNLESVAIDAHWGLAGMIPNLAGLAGVGGKSWLLGDQGLHPAPQFTARGLQHLAGLPRLTALHISLNTLTDADMAAVAKLTGLKKLTLFAPQVTDEGLLQVKALKKLESLDLRGTQATVATAATLRALPALKLVRTNLQPFDPQYRARLAAWKRALPRATIKPLYEMPGL